MTMMITQLRQAANRIAPVWPLADFVAVNPFLGLAELPFGEAQAMLGQVSGRPALPERGLFAAAIARGRITEADLAAAIAAAGASITPEELRAIAQQPRPAAPVSPAAMTVSDVLDSTLGTGWTRLATEEIAKWLAAWADDGQASWAMPWRGQPLYAAWRAAAKHDRAPEVAGLTGFRALIATLPADAAESSAASLAALGIVSPAAYLHRALIGLAGWGATLRQRGWLNELGGEANDGVIELLAIRLAWEQALHAHHTQPAFHAAWQERLMAPPAEAPDLTADLLLLDAYERGYRRELGGKLAQRKARSAPAPLVQAAFCIDVRSEVYRRALEEVTLQAETIGFAGFFGFALEYVRLGDTKGAEQCPVLLKPGLLICEAVQGASPEEEAQIAAQRGLKRRAADLWNNFRNSAVSSFAYVETAGFLAAPALVRGTLGKREPLAADGLDPALLGRLGPTLEARPWQSRAHGFASEKRLDAAEGVLRALSLTHDFAPIVLLAGHGSSTVNNPHAAGLDCGACGGHTGESNARVAAAVLNDPAVRAGLAPRGIVIPPATRFVAALHDTTTDEVALYDADMTDPNIRQLRGWLDEASRRARRFRAGSLGISGAPDAAIARRSTDWSEVRPEWGLVNNAAFIVAPRSRTQGLDLGGRSFLHSYAWQEDKGFGVLELIMTAPMVVANWINLQYYGSTVDNAAMGSGNKVLHNVTGRFGVLEGQGGDLRTGLPMQSLHDGASWRHEPMRLHVVIEAPEDAMEDILRKHAGVRQLVENGWLHLFSLEGESGAMRRYHGPGRWLAE
ncbi:YbcC family protein [Sediminicoccus sp. BL-A-41-H5]|uniref:YbcC family protein n=1 Tax=Sediminicoccus sp. BL-A-41-H5 TaxID=3421106 RepID=UPI003D66D378